MTIVDLSTTQLKLLVKLIRQRESLQAQLAKVNAALAQLDGVRPKLPSPKAKSFRRGRTTLRDSILKVLAEAGPSGLKIKEIAARAKLNQGSVAVWMYTSASKVGWLKKIAPGKFAYQRP